MGILGSVVGFVGGMQQSKAMGKEADIYAAQGDQSKQLADLSASDALSRGAQAAGVAQTRGSQTIGAQQVGYASSGVDTSSGTPLEMMADTRMLSSYDQAVIKNNAAREAFGYKIKGLREQEQGYLNAYGAANNAQSAQMGAVGDLLGGFTQTGMTAAKLA